MKTWALLFILWLSACAGTYLWLNPQLLETPQPTPVQVVVETPAEALPQPAEAEPSSTETDIPTP